MPGGAIGLATGMAVGRAFPPSTAADVCVPALGTAEGRGCVAGGAVFRSDRGSRCTGSLLAGWAREDDVRLSVGGTGCRRDDAVAGSLWASLKDEMYRRRTSAARDEAKFACIEWIEGFHDRRRPRSSIGYRHPADVMADSREGWRREAVSWRHSVRNLDTLHSSRGAAFWAPRLVRPALF